MTKILRGVVHGRIIEVTEDIGMADGQAVELIVTADPQMDTPTEDLRSPAARKKLPGPPPGWRPGASATAAGMLASEWTEEDERILARIQSDRRAAKWRELSE